MIEWTNKYNRCGSSICARVCVIVCECDCVWVCVCMCDDNMITLGHRVSFRAYSLNVPTWYLGGHYVQTYPIVATELLEPSYIAYHRHSLNQRWLSIDRSIYKVSKHCSTRVDSPSHRAVVDIVMSRMHSWSCECPQTPPLCEGKGLVYLERYLGLADMVVSKFVCANQNAAMW